MVRGHRHQTIHHLNFVWFDEYANHKIWMWFTVVDMDDNNGVTAVASFV